jgi:hypothetical protein
VEVVAAGVEADPEAAVALGQVAAAPDREAVAAFHGRRAAVAFRDHPVGEACHDLPLVAALGQAAESQAAVGHHHSARRAVIVHPNCRPIGQDLLSAAAGQALVIDLMLAAVTDRISVPATDPTSATGHRSCRAIGPMSARALEGEIVPAEIDLRTCRPLARTSADALVSVPCRRSARAPSPEPELPIALVIARATCRAWANGRANCPIERPSSDGMLCKIA